MASDDLYRALLARLDEDASRWHRGDRLRRDVDQTRAALRAAVELHAPHDRGAGPTCKGCEIKGVGFIWHDRCSTIRTIAEALGVTEGVQREQPR